MGKDTPKQRKRKSRWSLARLMREPQKISTCQGDVTLGAEHKGGKMVLLIEIQEKAMPVIEITMDELQQSYDWEEVFGEGSGGNCTNETDPCPPDAKIDTSPPKRADVTEIIAAVNGDNEGPDWIGVFRLKDGRYLVAQGGCDYTGWDCQASNSMHVGATLDDVLQYGLGVTEFERLGLELPEAMRAPRQT